MNENKTILVDEQGAASGATSVPHTTPTKSKVVTTPILQKRLGSKFAKVTPSFAYNPAPKPPSKRDKHRCAVANARLGIR